MKVVVLGMHRSGTSLACGLLNLCGVYFGEENDLIQTNEENPKGFWERKDIRKLNDMLLHQMDCDWSEITALHQKAIPGSVLDNFTAEASGIIEKLDQGSSTGVIGLKEPRLCLLTPYWNGLFNDDDFFLLVHRDPEEIAISLENRNGIPTGVSHYLTERYLEDAIEEIRNRHHLLVSFKELIELPVQAIERIITAINTTGHALASPDSKQLVAYSSPDLYRSRSKKQTSAVSNRLQHIYDCLYKSELPQAPDIEIQTPRLVLTYQHTKRFQEFRSAQYRLENSQKRIDQLENKTKADQASIVQLEDKLETLVKQLSSLNQMLIIAHGKQTSQGWKIKRHELTIDEATSEIVTTRSLLADSNRKLEQTRQDTQSLLKISNKLIDKLQLLFSSSTWNVSKRFIAFMLQPTRLGRESVLLDEIDHDIEELRQWNTAALNKLNSGLNGYIQEYEPVESPPGVTRQEADLPESDATDIPHNSILPFKGKIDGKVKIGLVVTEDSDTTSAGDFFTAKELATALKNEHGWDCVYLPENSESADWYDVSDLDILLVLLDKYDISSIHSQNKPLLKIAWIRNWVDRWTFRPWFQGFDLVVCTSEVARQYVYDHTGKLASILKIAANTDRFHPNDKINPDLKSDYCFTGSYWGAPRQIENLDPSKLPYEFALFGAGWEQHDQFVDSYRGNLPYDKLPEVYTSTLILVDDANHVTKPWASVNSRVFDALAAGILVISNGISGAMETFGDLLPTYSTNQELIQQLRYFLDHPDERNRLAKELHQLVLQEHCYKTRAQQFAGILRDELGSKARVAIKVPIPHVSDAIHWNEFRLAQGLAAAPRRTGYSVRLDFIPEWYSATAIPDDVVITLGEYKRYKPDNSVINLLWIINHPAEPEMGAYDDYHQVFVASEQYAAQLGERTQTPVMPLLLCTDPELFSFKEPPHRSDHVVFIGNSERKSHPILEDAITAGLKPMIIGSDWDGMIDDSLIAGEYIEQKALPGFYASSGVVLCDLEQNTSGCGFIPSQLFDAIACGAVPVCHSMPGIKEIFDDLVYQCSSDPDEISLQVQKALNEDANLRPQREEVAEIIGRDHSFETRAGVIDSVISNIFQSKNVT